MPRGGARPNSGPKKGSKQPHTLDKLMAREFVRQRVIASLDGLIEAQVANAKGLKYLVVRNNKTGKFERVSKDRMDALLMAGDDAALERLEIWDKDPSVQAFTDLLNRALDKPAEQKQELDVTLRGESDLVARLAGARKREKT